MINRGSFKISNKFSDFNEAVTEIMELLQFYPAHRDMPCSIGYAKSAL